MNTIENKKITVESTINAPVEKVWNWWTAPEHIIHWNHASDDWHTPAAENDLRMGGKFSYRMEAKDGSFGFDFWGNYTNIENHRFIGITLGDGRKVELRFSVEGNKTKIIESFEPEDTNPFEMQKSGWQAILDNFRKYAEIQNSLKI